MLLGGATTLGSWETSNWACSALNKWVTVFSPTLSTKSTSFWRKQQSIAVSRLKRGEDDNPTIGIILCDSKDETIVKYSVMQENHHLFASKYQRILPTEDELIAEIAREKRLIDGLK